jgi:hypothetical protein
VSYLESIFSLRGKNALVTGAASGAGPPLREGTQLTTSSNVSCVVQYNKFEPLMTGLGHVHPFCDVCGTSALPPILTVTADILNRQLRAMNGR